MNYGPNTLFGPHTLFTAARDGVLHELQRLIKDGANIEDRDGGPFDRTALFHAVMGDHVDVTRALLKNGADVMSIDSGGWTPLHAAVIFKSKECVSLLLEYDADVWAEQRFGSTPLHWGTFFDNFEMLRILISKAVAVPMTDYQTRVMQSVMKDAIIAGHNSCVKLLLVEAHVDIDYAMSTAEQYKRRVIIRMFRRELQRRKLCLAFGMGNVKRLGDNSLVRLLDVGVVDMIMKKFYVNPS